jgi:hypothetical protein
MGLIPGLLTLFLGSPGQLAARIKYLNGSLDKPWLLLFLLPPLSIISSIWFFFDWVEEGKGSDPVDDFMYALPITSVIFTFIFYNLCDASDFISTPLVVLFNIMMFAVARVYRKMEDCSDNSERNFGSAVQKGITSAILSQIINVVIGFMGYLPYIGIVFKLWDVIGIVPGLDVGILCAIINLYLNMEVNSNDESFNKMCNNKQSILTLGTASRFAIASVISIALSFIP